MPNLPKRKVGLISCSGEELPCGTLARVATLRVLEQLRPDDTVTICLPLFLAGNDKERSFAKFFPTITIDGCDKRCAARATEKYSAMPTASIVIPEFLAERHVAEPPSRRQASVTDHPATGILAQEIAQRVDAILGLSQEPHVEPVPENAPGNDAAAATCSCGSGVPVMQLDIAGKSVEVVALPLIFEQARQASQSFDAILDQVKIYNAIPAGLEPAYRDAIQRAYAAFCARP